MRSAESATLNVQLIHCVEVPRTGLPRAVMQAEEVCTREPVTALTDNILTSDTRVSLSPAESEPKIIFAATGAKIYSATAAGADTASVIKSDLYAVFLAFLTLPLSASGDICGTLDAASPYVTETGKFIMVMAQPE